MPKIDDQGNLTGSYYMHIKGFYHTTEPVSLKTGSKPS
jgi:hypothetical protein